MQYIQLRAPPMVPHAIHATRRNIKGRRENEEEEKERIRTTYQRWTSDERTVRTRKNSFLRKRRSRAWQFFTLSLNDEGDRRRRRFTLCADTIIPGGAKDSHRYHHYYRHRQPLLSRSIPQRV